MSKPREKYSDKTFSFDPLKGKDDYLTWSIQMEDMFNQIELWKYVDGTEARPTTTGSTQTTWDTEDCIALGIIRCRVTSQPIIHIARCNRSKDAYDTLQQHYSSIGVGSMTLHQTNFTSPCMKVNEDMKKRVQNL